MIWLTWRQHRLQVLCGAALLALLAALMIPSGFAIGSVFRSSGLAGCLSVPGRNCADQAALFTPRYSGLWFTIPLFLVLPALIGVFWGAPLVAREVEQGTHRLAWTQGVSRLRWASTKLVAFVTATVLGVGLLAWLVSWWSQYFVAASDDRLSPGVFDLRGIVPVAYALFALAVGVAAGVLIRRTIPAMVASLGAYAGIRLAVELWLRPRFASPRTLSYPFFAKTYPRSGLGDWILSTKTLDRAGHLLARGASLDFNVLAPRCPGLIPQPGSMPSQSALQACIHRIGLHVQATYQPGTRFWAFQGIETAIFAVLAFGLLGFSLWWIRARLS
jgi:hypothetical protein